MEKRNRKAGHSYSLRDRILAQIMVIIVTLTMIPFDSLVARAATTTNVKSIGSIQTEYEVDNGTSKDDIGLPSELSVIIETVTSAEDSTSGITNEYSEDTVEKSVSWEGDYNGDKAGTYTLRAEFDDSSLYYDDMPTVSVTVREAETEPEPTAPEVNKTEDEDGDDDEDPDQGKSEQNTADEVTEEASKPVAEDDAKEEVVKKDAKAALRNNNGSYSDDFEDFIHDGDTHVVITDKDGNVKENHLAVPGDTLEVNYSFSELPTTGSLQMWIADDFTVVPINLHTMTLDLPEDIDWSRISPVNYQLSFRDPVSQQTYTMDATASINGNTVEFNWDADPSDDSEHGDIYKLMRLSEMGDMVINLSIYGTITEKTDKIELPGGVVIPVDNTSKIRVGKYFTPAAVESIVKANDDLKEDTKFSVDLMVATVDPDGDYVRDENHHIVYHSDTVTFTYKNILEGNGLYEIAGVKGGTDVTYTVKETAVPSVSGYDFLNVNGTSTTLPAEHSITVDNGDVKEVSFTNNYEKRVGKIVVKKLIDGDLTADKLLPGQRAGMTFKVTKEGSSSSIANFSFDQFTHNSDGTYTYTISDLEEGNYVVTETVTAAGEVPGFTRTTTYAVETGHGSADSDKANPIVSNHHDTLVTVTNSYEQKYGDLKISKTLDKTEAPGLTDELTDGITFTVTAGGQNVNFVKTSAGAYHYVKKVVDGDTTKYVSTVDGVEYAESAVIHSVTYGDIKSSGEFTILGLPCGVEYTVTETNMKFGDHGFVRTTKVSVNGGNATSGESGKTTAVEDATHSIAFSNTYSMGVKLTIKKSIDQSGDLKSLTTDQKKAMKFKLYKKLGDTPDPETDTLIGTKSYNDLNSSTGYTWSGLDFGDYYVVESGQEIANYNCTTTATITEYTLKPDGTAEEHTSTSTGLTAEATVGEASYNKPSVIAFKNKYMRERGTLQIAKTLDTTGIAEDDLDSVKEAIVFSINRTAPSAATYDTFTYKDLEDAYNLADKTIVIYHNADHSGTAYYGKVSLINGTYKVVFDGDESITGNHSLPTGTYVITEAGDYTGYSLTAHVATGKDAADETDDFGKSATVSFADGETGKAAFSNAYKPSGLLKISKTWGPTLTQAEYDKLQQAMRFVIRDADGNTVYKRDAQGQPTTDNLFTYDELTGPGVVVEAGKEYTVEEVNTYVNVDGYTRTTEITNTVNFDTDNPQSTNTKTIVVNPTDPSAPDTISDPSIVNMGHTTEFAFYNRYAGGVGPGAGAYIYKNYSGLESGQYPGDPERDVLHSRIIIKFTHYVSATDKTPISEFCIPLAEAVEQGGIRLAEGGYYEIEELGRYTVTQDAHFNDVYTEDPDGEYSAIATDMYYDWNCKVKVGDSALMSDAPAKLTVPQNGFVGITFTNNYTPYGALKVTKDFTGLTAAQIGNLKSKIQFAVSRKVNGGWETVETFKLDNTNVVKVSDTSYYRLMTHLPVGEYKVEETISGEVTNYTRTSYVTVTTKTSHGSQTTVSTSEDDPANVVRGGAAADTTVPYPQGGTPDPLTVAFDNEYSQDKGDLIIEKAFGGDHDKLTPEQKNGITFTVFNGKTQVKWNDVEGTYVYDPNGSIGSFTYADMTDGKYNITNLPIATYTVKEENYQFDGFSVTATWSGGTNNTIAVVKNTTKTLKVTNTYKEFGKLLITKEFNPATAGTTTEGKAVSFTVYETNSDGTIKTDTSGNPVVAKDINNQPVTFTFDQMTSGSKSVDIAPGTYIVKEDGQEFSTENYVFVSATANGNPYNKENGVQAAVVRYAADDDNKTEVAFVNNYAESGSLKLIKTLNLPSDLDRTPEELQAMYNAIKFTIKDAEGNTVKWNDVSGKHVYAANGSISEVIYADMPTTGYVIEGLPAGNYEVTETIDGESAGAFDPSNPFHGLHRTTTYKINNEAVVNNKTTAENVPVVAAGTTVTFTNTYTEEDPVVVVKDGGKEPAGYVRLDDSGNIVEDGGTQFPYWQFQLTVSDIMDDLDITDTFDVSENNKASEWFRFVTSDETDLLGAFGVTEDSNVNEKIETVSGPAPTVTIDTTTAGKAIFHITDTDESQKSKIVITYFLIAKDKDAVIAMNENDGTSEEVKWTFTNEASYLPYPDATEPETSTQDYTYTCTGVEKDYDAEKTIVVRDMQGEARIYEYDDEGNPTESVRVSYKVTLNPSAQQLGTEEYLEAHDTLSDGLTLIESSVHVEPSDLGVTWKPCDCEGHPHTLDFEHIPNATTVTITYTAVFDKGGLQTFGNTIQFDTYLKVKTDEVHVTEEGQSGGHLSALNLYKYDEDDHSSRLGGAEFTLFDDTTGQKLTTYVTDANGHVLLYYYDDAHEHNINFGLPYHIEETKAPVGYEIPEDKNAVYFIIDSSKAGQTIVINDITYIYYASESELTMDDTPFDTEVQLGALKSLIGKTLEEGKFTFSLTAEDGAPSPSETSNTVTVTNGSDGKAVFDAITFDSGDLRPVKNDEGIVTDLDDTDFYYTVKEVEGTDPGITYDDTEYRIRVTVGLNSDNTDLVVKSVAIVHDDGDDEELDADHNVYFTDFENEYEAEGAMVLGIKKKIEGRKLRVEEFEFNLALNDADNTVVSAKNAEDHFTDLYNCDIVFPQVKYVVKDSEEPGYKDSTKVVEENGKYTVYIDPDVLNKTAGGKRYTEYNYTISEKRPQTSTNGITYDEHTYDLTVRVIDNGNGTVDVIPYVNNAAITANEDGVFELPYTFVNVYKAEGEATPEGKKTMVNGTLTAGQFEFDVKYNGEKIGKVTHDAAGKINYPTIKAVVKPEAADSELGMKTVTSGGYLSQIVITYKNIEDFDTNGYTFTFSEVKGTDTSIEYSTVTYNVKATVAIDTENESKLKVTVTPPKDLDFINTLNSASGEDRPAGHKSVPDGVTLEAGKFNFDIYYNGEVIATATNAADGTINYPWIKFALDGEATGTTVTYDETTKRIIIKSNNMAALKQTYTFTVKERNGGEMIDGFMYGNQEYTLTATSEEGSTPDTLKVNLSNNAKSLNFINTSYKAQGSDTPEGMKRLPDGVTLTAGQFKFNIEYDGAVIGQVTHDAAGNINYPEIIFVLDKTAANTSVKADARNNTTKITITANTLTELAKTYTFKISEVNGGQVIDGILYDVTEHELTATAAENADDKTKLDVTLSNNAKKLDFSNKEQSASGSGILEGEKSIPEGVTLEAGQFTFNISYNNQVIGTVTHDADGVINYPTIYFVLDKKVSGTTVDVDKYNNVTAITITANTVTELAKTYTFKIAEVNGGQSIDGFEFTDVIHTVTASAAPNPDDSSKLDVTLSDNHDKLDFVNDTYGAEGTNTPKGRKSVPEGVTLEEDYFTFLISYNDEVIGKVHNKADGNIKYPTVKFVLDKAAEDEPKVEVDAEDPTTLITITANTLDLLDDYYSFKIEEENGGETIDGITYASTVYTLTATATKNNSDKTKLDVKLSDNATALNFVNSSYNASGTKKISGTKSVPEGVDLSAYDFEFEIYYGETLLGTVTNDKTTGAINYPKVTFILDPAGTEGVTAEVVEDTTTVTGITVTGRKLAKLAETYTFTIKEVHGGEMIDGIKYYGEPVVLTATAAEDPTDNKKLVITMSDNFEALDFVNDKYTAEGEGTPKGTKILEGRKLKDKEFTFEIYYNNDVIGKFTNDANGKILYPTVKFVLDAGGTEGVTVDDAENTTLITVTGRSLAKLAETYTFHVEEKDTGESGVSYPENFFDFTATAKENASDKTKLDVTLSDANELDFINTYRAKGGSDRPEGKKIMKGRNLKAGEFTFEIKANDDNTVLGTVTNDADGKIVYPTFYYEVDPSKTAGRTVTLDADGFLEAVTIIYNNVEDLKEAAYTVTEVKYTGDNAEAGVTYDTSSSQKITVTPSVNTTDASKLDVKAVAEAGKEFKNTYKAKGQDGFTGIKWLDTRMPKDDEFTFVIKEGDTVLAEVQNVGTEIPYPDFQYVVDPDGTPGTTYDKNSNIITVVVNAVEDLAAGFNYTVSEKDEHIPYFGYDTKVYDLHVDVKATDEKIDEETAKLDVTITKSTENNFTNTYTAEGALELEAAKTLLGRILNSGEFTFELKDEKGTVLQTKHNDKTGKIVFDQIKYTLDNMNKDKNGHVVDTVIYYTVNEVVPEGGKKDGVTYDTNSYKIKVTLHDMEDGNIKVKVEDEFDSLIEAITAKYTFKNSFENFYAAEGKANFTGSKALRGRKIVADEFSFTISDANGVIATVKNKADGTITYPTFKYVVDHRVSETTTRYDKDANTIIMTVKNLEDMVNADTSVDPTVYSAKTYDYTVTEVEGSEAGVTYNTGTKTEYTVTATVSVNAADMGKLDVSFDPAKEVDFVNTYKAQGISQPITGTKALRGRIVTAKEFEFMIKAEDGTELGKVTNDENGVITYPQFEYIVDPDLEAGRTTTTDADGYLKTVTITYNNVEELKGATYTATEIVGTGIGITYDESTKETINVAVEVNADDASKLDVKAETKTDDVVFTNYYKARGEKKIFGDKKLTYRLPENEEFEFVISSEDGEEIAKVKNTDMINGDHSGKTIEYPTFRYIVDNQATPGTVYDTKKNVIIVTVNWVEDLKDGFTYKITEVNDGQTYFTYDTTEITLSVTVTPTGEEIEPHVEKLNVEIVDSEGNDFNNEYHAEGALQLYAEKTLLGRILNSGDFKFELNRTDETFENVIEKVDTKENVKNTVTFDLIEYNLDSMDKDEHGYVKDTKYYYTVSEVVPEGAEPNDDGTFTHNGVTYDPRVFQITATLHDNKKGLIVVTVKAKPAGAVTFFDQYKRYEFKFGNAFENFYHAEGENTISGTKTLRGRNLTEGEYQFEIKDTDGNVLATVSNDAEGNIKYPTFRYVVNHLAEETSYVFDKTNNTLTLTTNNLEDMVTPVDTSADPVEYESKDYVYTINEVIPEGAEPNEDGTYTFDGVTYNENLDEYTLKVTVAVNDEDMGILDVNIEPSEELDFINTYRAKGEDTVVGKKILKGADIKDFEGKFKFTVTDGEGNLITTVSNDAAGNILYPTFRYVVDPDLEAGAVYDEEENVYTVTVNAYEDLEDVYTFKVTELQGDIEDMAYNVGEKLEYEITVTVVADEEDHAILNVVAMPDTAVDFVNRQYFKAGLYKISEDTSEALKGAVIRLVRVDDGKIIDEWTTDGTVHLINLIEIGTGTFRFVEVKTPDGYEYARNIEFKMSEDGEFSSEYDHVFDKNGNAVFIMRDPSIPNTKTGDEAPLAAAGGAFAVGLAGLAAVIASKKRRA